MSGGVFFQHDDFDKLIDMVVDKVADKVSKMKTVEPTLTKGQAAKYLQVSRQTLEKRFREGDLPASLIHKNGGTPYFFASELEAYLKKS
jgi:excisionase family DNA binding protein